MAKPPPTRHERAARRVVVAAGKAAADAIDRARGGVEIDPEADFGGADIDEELEELGPPPPPPVPGREEKSQPPPALVALGDPPDDPAKAMTWLYKSLVISAHHAMNDTEISQATRRRELRTIAAAARALYPDSVKAEVARIIKQDKEELQRKKRVRATAALEKKAAAPTIAKVIPIRAAAGGDDGESD